MTVAVAPGTPAAGNPTASPAPAAVGAGIDSSAVDGVVGPSPDAGDGDETETARAKAREILFSDKTDEEVEAELAKVAKPAETTKPAEQPKDEVALSKKWAKLTAQEDRLVERQKKAAESIKSLEAREAAIIEREQLAADPVAFLQKQGWDKDRIVKWIQDDGKIDPETMVKQLDEKYRTEIANLKKEREQERLELENTRRTREMSDVENELNQEVLHLAKTDDELGVLKRLTEKNPKKFEPFIQKRVGSIIAEAWRKTFNQGEFEGTNKGMVVDPRDAMLYLQAELAELQLADPGQVPAVRSANPVAVEPTPITNQATSQRNVRPSTYDETDPEARRAHAQRILDGEIDE